MTTSIGLPSRLTSWTSLYANSSLWNLKTVSYAVAGIFLMSIGALLMRSRKKMISPELFCQQRHITLLQEGHVCINDLIHLRFDQKYAQGIFKIQPDNLIPPGFRNVYLYCRYKDHCFAFQHIPVAQLSLPLFIQNLPYQEEMTLQIFKSEDLNEKPLWEKTFKVEHALASYQIKAEENTPTITAEPYCSEGFRSLPLRSQLINESSQFVILGSDIVPSTSTEDHYVFDNRNPHMIKLNLEFSFDPTECYHDPVKPSGHVDELPLYTENDENVWCRSNQKIMKRPPQHVMIPVIVPPKAKIQLSKEFILQTFRDIFLRAMTTRKVETLPENPDLRLMNIQPIFYYPEKNGK